MNASTDDDGEAIAVEILYALPQDCFHREVLVAPETTVRTAIEQSGVLTRYPEIALDSTHKVGIYGKVTKLDTALREHDRIEIYRPLIADPKTARKKRAAQKAADDDKEKPAAKAAAAKTKTAAAGDDGSDGAKKATAPGDES